MLQGQRVHDLTWRARVLWFLIGAVVAVASVQAVRMTMRDQAVKKARLAKVTAQRQALPPLPVDVGESYDGEVLADDDPRKGERSREPARELHDAAGDDEFAG